MFVIGAVGTLSLEDVMMLVGLLTSVVSVLYCLVSQPDDHNISGSNGGGDNNNDDGDDDDGDDFHDDDSDSELSETLTWVAASPRPMPTCVPAIGSQSLDELIVDTPSAHGPHCWSWASLLRHDPGLFSTTDSDPESD